MCDILNEKCLQEIRLLVDRYPMLAGIYHDLAQAVEVLALCCMDGCKILVCGNGGSAADSLHIVGELMKGFVSKRPISSDLRIALQKIAPDEADYYSKNLQQALPTISLVSEVALLTAYSNDKTADLIFAQQVLGYGKAGDVLLNISTSGNSINVLHAAKVARALGLKVISLTGEEGGKLKLLSDIWLPVPSTITYQVQEYHLPIYHTICLALEKQFFVE